MHLSQPSKLIWPSLTLRLTRSWGQKSSTASRSSIAPVKTVNLAEVDSNSSEFTLPRTTINSSSEVVKRVANRPDSTKSENKLPQVKQLWTLCTSKRQVTCALVSTTPNKVCLTVSNPKEVEMSAGTHFAREIAKEVWREASHPARPARSFVVSTHRWGHWLQDLMYTTSMVRLIAWEAHNVRVNHIARSETWL